MKDDNKTKKQLIDELTELRSQNAALKKSESEENFRAIFDRASDGILIADAVTKKLFQGNTTLCSMLGCTKEEIKSLTIYDIHPPNDVSRVLDEFEKLLKGEKALAEDLSVLRKDGTIFYADIGFTPITFRGIPSVVCILRDITERKRAEEALRESRDEIQWLFKSMINAFVLFESVFDNKGNFISYRFIYINDAYERITGVKNDEVKGKTVHEVWPETEPEWIKKYGKVAVTGVASTFDLYHDPTKKFYHCNVYRPWNTKDRFCVIFEDITERKRAEASLREKVEDLSRLATVVSDSNDAVIMHDLDGKILAWNRGAKETYGYTETEALGKNVRDIVAETDREVALTLIQKIKQGEIVKSFELRRVTKDGRILDVWLTTTLLTDEKGKPVAIATTERDITDRKRAEEALRESEETYRLVVDNMADVISVMDMNLHFTYVSPSIMRMRGYTAEEAVAQTFEQIMTPESHQIITKVFEEEIKLEASGTAAPGRNRIMELEEYKKDGSIVWIENSLSYMRDKAQKPIGIISLSRDITERKRAEEELRLSEERFRRIFDEGPFGMGLVSPDSTIIAVNKMIRELLGYTEQELVGQCVADITHKEDRDKSKEILGQLFASSIPVFRLEKRYIKKDGTILWANTSISAIHGKEGNVLYGLAIIEDLTEVRKTAEKIHRLAFYDGLTGLPNRTFHKELIKRSIEHAHRRKEIFALIYIGLDNFKRINDTLGYRIGDLLLKAVADRLANSMRKSDHVARASEGETEDVISRVGGDEFIILAYDITQPHYAATTSRRLLEGLSAPYDLNGREVFITVSIGIALYPDDGTDVDNLLKNAEKAMRHTKNEGKNNFHFYSSSMHTSVLKLLTLENDLHRALERKELVLYYQPKVDAATRRVKGMEALIRWIHPDKGLIPPMQFIPMAETSGLIIPIGEFVIRTVCKQIKTWRDAGFKQMNVAINISSYQFDKQNLIEIVKKALQDTMISPQCLELEITESTIMRNPEKAIKILTDLNAMGIGIAIDDFGTGYSSLSHLKRLPLDFLKIDQSFVKGVASDPRDQAIVKMTIAMAHSLKLKTIAEGVETEEQLCFLQEHGCDEIQGYLFSRPLPAGEIPEILTKGYL